MAAKLASSAVQAHGVFSSPIPTRAEELRNARGRLSVPVSRSAFKLESSSLFGSRFFESSPSSAYCVRKLSKGSRLCAVRAAVEGEVYTVELEKPIGLKFYKGEDAGTYIDFIIPGQNAEKTGLFTPGDKILETSAVFGDELWPAAEFGRTMYSIRQRAGILTLVVEKRNGVKIKPFKAREAYLIERNSGNYGDAIRDKQIENYTKKQELKAQRLVEIDEGLTLYKQGEYAEALIRFETVLELQPDAREKCVTYYNIACSYSNLNKIPEALAALEAALEFGFEDYKTIRTDPDLANLRASEGFKPLIDRYDEPFINENAINAIKNVFGIFSKK